MADLAHRFKTFAYNLLANGVRQEYENQLTKWKIQTNNLIAYAKLAQKSQNDYFNAIRAQEAAQAQAVMFALSLLAGPALSFLTGTLQYKLAPKIFLNERVRKIPNPNFKPTLPPGAATVALKSTPKPTLPKPFAPGYAKKGVNPSMVRTTDGPKVEAPNLIEVRAFDPDYNKALGKVFGDFGSTLTSNLAANRARAAVEPSQADLKSKIDVASDGSVSLELFESRVNNVWEAAKAYGSTGIQNYAGTILNDPEWGERFMAQNNIPAGEKAIPYVKQSDREEYGMQLIRKMVDDQRAIWARNPDWFYYGNDPAPITQAFTVNAIEAELWAIWIANEGFRLEHYHYEDADGVTRGDGDEAKGRSGIVLDKIVKRLVTLGIVTTESAWEYFRRNGSVDGILPAEIKDVDGNVDTQAELWSVLNWAKRTPGVLGGNFGFVPRTIDRLDPTNIPR